MTQKNIIDTSPLVALIDKSDNFHNWIVEIWKTISIPLYTCEAVISETCFLLDKMPRGKEAVMGLLRDKVIEIPFQLSQELDEVSHLMQRYSSVPMSFADACLVRMSELIKGSSILTLDSDFLIYRKNRNQTIEVIIPDELNLK